MKTSFQSTKFKVQNSIGLVFGLWSLIFIVCGKLVDWLSIKRFSYTSSTDGFNYLTSQGFFVPKVHTRFEYFSTGLSQVNLAVFNLLWSFLLPFSPAPNNEANI